jgi:hypothetical protein
MTNIADGAVVNITTANYDTNTIFKTVNGGSFIPSNTPTSEVVSPTVTSDSATSVTDTTVSLQGSLTDTGGASVTEHGFIYGTDPSLLSGTTTSTLGFSTALRPFT